MVDSMENYNIISSDSEQDKLNDKQYGESQHFQLTLNSINWMINSMENYNIISSDSEQETKLMAICRKNYNVISSDYEQDKLNGKQYGELQHFLTMNKTN